MVNLDLDSMTDIDIYRVFVPDGKEPDALTGSYPELVELIGCEATLKLFKHFRGSKIDCPKFLYRQDYLAEMASHVSDKRERAKIAIASGYTVNRLEALVGKRKKENDGNKS